MDNAKELFLNEWKGKLNELLAEDGVLINDDHCHILDCLYEEVKTNNDLSYMEGGIDTEYAEQLAKALKMSYEESFRFVHNFIDYLLMEFLQGNF